MRLCPKASRLPEALQMHNAVPDDCSPAHDRWICHLDAPNQGGSSFQQRHPGIQEAILILPFILCGIDSITEHDLRGVAAHVDWPTQAAVWKTLVQHPKAASLA